MNFRVERENAIVRGVSVITSGVVAKGHGLLVDQTTLAQLKSCADARGRVPVKIDHSGGAGSVVGFLTNFQIEGNKLTADWHLLQSHAMTPQLLEVAERMPGGVGLSAAFIAPDNAEKGKARCSELISVDFVALPAANPSGLFSATIDGRRVEFAALSKVGRAALAGATAGSRTAVDRIRQAGIKIPQKLPPPLNGVGTTLKRTWRLNKPTLKRAAVSGAVDAAIVGATVYGVGKIQQRQQEVEDRAAARRAKRRALSANVKVVMFGRSTPALHRVSDAVRDNLPDPELPPQVGIARRVWRSDAARAARLKALRIAVLTGGGAYAGHKLLRRDGAKIGGAAGAVAGVLFENPQTQRVIRAGIEFTSSLS